MKIRKTAESRGTALERFIADLTSMFFLNDFVYLSPSYMTSAHKRQLTDLMFLLNGECVLVSIKGTDGNEKTTNRLALWAAKKAQQASKNAKTACQRTAKLVVTATKLWGEQRTFPAGSLAPICGLGIVECSQEMFQPIEFTLSSTTKPSAHPIHCLSANDFLNVVNWLGSIWDVFNYLKLRKQVSGLLNGINIERPLV